MIGISNRLLQFFSSKERALTTFQESQQAAVYLTSEAPKGLFFDLRVVSNCCISVWTLAATKGQRTQPTTSSLNAIPTPAHMALLKLQQAGLLKHIVRK